MPIAISRQQGTFHPGTTTSPFSATVLATVVGERLLVALTSRAATGTFTVSSASGTWQQVAHVASSSGICSWFECRDAAASITSISWTGPANYTAMRLFEVSGHDAAVASAGTASTDATADSAWNCGPYTPTAGNRLLLALMGGTSTTNTRAVSAVTAGWSTAVYNAGSATTNIHGSSTRILTVDGVTAYTCTFTGNASATNSWAMAAVPEAAAGGTPITRFRATFVGV